MIAVAVVLALALGQAPEELVRQLGAEEAAQREEAAQALEALGEKAVAALEAGAKSDDPEVRERASEVLRTVRTTIAVGQRLDLERLAQVRAAIDDWRSRGVGGRVDEISAPTAYDDLWQYPRDKRGAPDPADIPYLLAILWDPGPCEGVAGGLPRDRYLRYRALQAIRCFAIADENEAHLVSILRTVLPTGERPSDEADERYWAALFCEAAQVTQPAVRKAIRDRVLSAMRTLASSENARTRVCVARGLGRWDDAESVPILSELIGDRDPEVQFEAIAPMEELDPTPYASSLAAALPVIQAGATRCVAAYALARCGDRSGIDALFALFGTPDKGGAWIDAGKRLPRLLDLPIELLEEPDAWRGWWKENRDRVRWDPDREVFVAE